MRSSYVFSVANKVRPLIESSGKLANEMKQKTQDTSSYWHNLGQADFQQKCVEWVRDCNSLTQLLGNLQTRIQGIAAALQLEEQREEERRRAAARQKAQSK